MVPDISRREWAEAITGTLKPQLTVLSLQMKLNSLQIAVRLRNKNLEDAISDLRKFVSSDEKKYQKDLNSIFNLH
jgi:hypothetical protein